MSEATHIRIDLNVESQNGLNMLREDMETYPSFDPDPLRYEEKNAYINRANQLGLLLLRTGHAQAAEFYYTSLLNAILDFESSTGKNFNKGIAYVNLGIAEMRSGKFDIGIPHMLIANKEDAVVSPGFDVLNTRLWWQFEEQLIYPYLTSYSNYTGGLFALDKDFLDGLMRSLNTQDRIFFEGAILNIAQNRSLNSELPNSYSLGQLYSALKDVCLLTESLLRKHQSTDTSIDLLKLLRKAVASQNITVHNTDAAKTWAGSLRSFLEKFESIESEPNSALRWLLHLLLIRNFTGHHFDVSDSVRSPGGKTFFPELYDVALQNVILAMLYLKHIRAF